MALFGGPSKEEKQAKELEKFMQRYHLDDLDPRDLETVRSIASDLAGNGMLKLGISLSGKPEDTAKITYLSVLVQQNWLIINQLARISKQLENK